MFNLIINNLTVEYSSKKELLFDIKQVFNNKILLLIRGCPGSGKTTLAKELANLFNLAHFEADMYFEVDGNYIFDKSKLQAAHEWCYNQVIDTLLKNKSVCVSNTFVKKWEMQKFINAAKDFKIELIIIECLNQYTSLHQVPLETIERMRRQWQSF